MNMWAIIGAGLATIIALIVATFLVAGAERFWRLFGEPDLGPVSFEQLERRATPKTRLPVLRISARRALTLRRGSIRSPLTNCGLCSRR
jgi:hypothetical protein